MRTGRVALLVLGAFLLMGDDAVAQCAMCRRALESPEGRQLVAALRAGIVVLLAAPFATFAAVAFLAVRRQRRRGETLPSTGLARLPDQVA